MLKFLKKWRVYPGIEFPGYPVNTWCRQIGNAEVIEMPSDLKMKLEYARNSISKTPPDINMIHLDAVHRVAFYNEIEKLSWLNAPIKSGEEMTEIVKGIGELLLLLIIKYIINLYFLTEYKEYSCYNKVGDTPLITAVRGSAMEMVESLSMIVDINQAGALGQTPLMVAAEMDQIDIGKMLLRESGKY